MNPNRPRSGLGLRAPAAPSDFGFGVIVVLSVVVLACVLQCRAAGVACFVKQMGRVTICTPEDRGDTDGGVTHEVFTKEQMKNPECWTEDLRVREFPRAVEVRS